MPRVAQFIGLLFALALVLAAAAPAEASKRVRFGIADQHATMFADERWQAMELQITRYNVPWNAVSDDWQRTRVLQFVAAADAAGVEVLLHINGRRIDGKREPLPTVAAYRREVGKLMRLLEPYDVRTWGAWNEANHGSQPTFKHPERAAQYFLALRSMCKGCTIVAADVLTQGSPRSRSVSSYRGWLGRFYRALGSKRSLARIVGIHNYGELMLPRGPYLSRDLIAFTKRYNRKTKFWITESGGIASSKSRWCNLGRQTLGTRRMFLHAAALAPWGVDRLYQYNWTAHKCSNEWDSGLIRSDGSSRPALNIVRRESRRFSR